MYDMSMMAIKTMKELQVVAQSYNLPLKTNENKTNLLTRIIAAHNSLTPDQPKSVDKPVFVKHETSEEDIIAEAAKYKDKGMEIRFLDEDTWHVRCKGEEDTGTRWQPIIVIARRFKEVAKGARLPRGIKGTGGKVMLTA